MRAPRVPKIKVKLDPAKREANRKAIAEALIRNLNANVLKEAAEHSKSP